MVKPKPITMGSVGTKYNRENTFRKDGGQVGTFILKKR